jgi:predicted DNA binding CopG/RHH family protein
MKRKEAVKVKLVAARIPEPLARQLKIEAAKRDMKLQDLIAEALTEYLAGARRKSRGDQ